MLSGAHEKSAGAHEKSAGYTLFHGLLMLYIRIFASIRSLSDQYTTWDENLK